MNYDSLWQSQQYPTWHLLKYNSYNLWTCSRNTAREHEKFVNKVLLFIKNTTNFCGFNSMILFLILRLRSLSVSVFLVCIANCKLKMWGQKNYKKNKKRTCGVLMKERSKDYLKCNCVIKHNTDGEQTAYLLKPFQGTGVRQSSL